MSSSQYLADLKQIRQAYIQDVKENYSIIRVTKASQNVNTVFYSSLFDKNKDEVFEKTGDRPLSFFLKHLDFLNLFGVYY